MIIIDTMIEVTLISIGFIIGFLTTTFSHKVGSRTVENAYNFQQYQDYVETNGLEYQDTQEEEEPDNSEFEDLLNGKWKVL